MAQPRASIIVPTTPDRGRFNSSIYETFIRQDYPNKEILWDFSEGTIGAKRNSLCARATGEVIITMDDDDFYSPDWVSKSVEALLTSEADVTGLIALNFYDIDNHAAYRYTYDLSPEFALWLAGATLCYRKSFWEQNKFRDMQVGEDAIFVSKAKSIYPHGHINSFLATIHECNTSKREVGNAINWRRLVGEEEQEIKERWKL